MTQQVYKQLYETMKARRGPYTGVDIPEFYELVEELFTPVEAAVNNAMTRQPATVKEIAARMKKPDDETGAILEEMADKGLCKTYRRDGIRYYEGELFMPQVNLDRCVGCAVCATGCPVDAIAMEAKPDFPTPPKDTKELIASLKAKINPP